MGTLFVDKLDPQSGTSLEIGSSGDTITIPSGCTITNSGTSSGFGISSANTPMFFAIRTSNQSLSHDTHTKIQFNSEIVDTNSAYDNSSNYRFTVPSGQAGKYYIFCGLRWSDSSANLATTIYLNGSAKAVAGMKPNSGELQTLCMQTILDLSVSDYVEIYGRFQSSGTLNVFGGSQHDTFFGGYKLT